MGGHVGDAQRLRVVDQTAEQTPAPGQPDARQVGPFLFGESGGDELCQALALLVQHAQGTVAGADQVHRRGDDPVQHHRQLQLPADGQHRLQQPLQAGLGACDSVDLPADLVQLGVQAQLQPGPVRLLHRLHGVTLGSHTLSFLHGRPADQGPSAPVSGAAAVPWWKGETVGERTSDPLEAGS
ncbi:hypothetical protein [Streptomyces bluensis]|uniref:hypothetical protein n=1 Tax=Streptomyces bluensis TaxID=33897 RepID=UPI0019A97CC6|nr:hypothetical protein GCM10010344_08920 [Streptomyces bluensis]